MNTLHADMETVSSAETGSAGLAQTIDHALRADELLRITDYPHLQVTAQGGFVSIRGHVVTAENKQRVEKIVRRVPGVIAVQNYLVVDNELVNEVRQAFDRDPQTRGTAISIQAQHGVIYLIGVLPSADLRTQVEAVAATLPRVRGVVNYLQAPGVVIQADAQDVVQPVIGEQVFMRELPMGQVEQVVIDPLNRRVTAVVVQAQLTERQTAADPFSAKPPRILFPIRSRHRDFRSMDDLDGLIFEWGSYWAFNPLHFTWPPARWQPPYPYRQKHVLFAACT